MKTIEMSVEYASQALNEVPFGYIDKTVCGCGFTTVAIESPFNTVIAVPNKNLVYNKAAQYHTHKEAGLYLFSVDGDVTKERVDTHIEFCRANNILVKLIVTYDAIWKVKHLFDIEYWDAKYWNGKMVRGCMNPLRLIIDESNKCLTSATLKSKDGKAQDVITSLLEFAETIKDRVSFISATPVPLSYMPNWMSDIEHIKYLWCNTTKVKPYLMKRTYPAASLKKEIISVIEKNGEVTIGDIRAKKLIVFINSVNGILKICKEVGLKPSDVAIIAGDTVENDAKLGNYKRLEDPRKLPKYTFITSSGFEGIDLYDEDAVTVVMSNSSIKHQMIDLLTDLKQTISRQRVKKNPNYDKFIYIYNQTIFDETEETLLNELNNWEKAILDGIELCKKNPESGRLLFFKGELINDFRVYTSYKNNDLSTLELNRNLFNADKYFILEVRKQYLEGFDVRGAMDNGKDAVDVAELESVEVNKLGYYRDMVDLARNEVHRIIECDRVKLIKDEEDYVKYKEFDKTELQREEIVSRISWGGFVVRTEDVELISKLYVKTGKMFKNKEEAVKVYSEASESQFGKLKSVICRLFVAGKEYTRAEIKAKLASEYSRLGMKRTAKHTDIYEFFECREKKVKGERSVEILKRK